MFARSARTCASNTGKVFDMLYIEPHAGVAPIIQVIASARHTVHLNAYLLDDRPILAALRAAHARGVQVEVIIEGKPYGLKPWKVQKEARAIAATGASVKYAPARFESSGRRWVFDHAKYVASGHEVEIGSANMSWAAFHKNREYLYVTKNPAVVKATNMVFNADWNNQRAGAYPHQVLVLSPGSGPKLLSAINQPGPIDVESEELGHAPAIMRALEAKGSQAHVILPANINREDRRNVNTLKAHGVQVRLMPIRPIFCHAKMITGARFSFIGSENFTDISTSANRETGLLLGGRDNQILQAQFDRDWARSG